MVPMYIFLLFIAIDPVFPDVVLGGIFDENPTDLEIFTNAVNALNTDPSLVNFQFLTEQIGDSGGYGSLRSTCSLLAQESLVIFGPKNLENIHTVQAICDYKDVTHVVTRWSFNPDFQTSTINFHPHSTPYLANAYLSILKLWDWKSFMVLFESNESILRVTELIRAAKDNGVIVTVKKLDPNESGNYRRSLKEALKSGEVNFVIDCSIDILENVLVHLQQVGLMTQAYNYFITSLDLHTLDLEPFQYSQTNITGIRLFDPEHPKLANYGRVRTETALLIDAVTILASAIQEQGPESFQIRGVNCTNQKSYKHGATISAKVKSGKYEGITGNIEFDNKGLRHNFNLDVVELTEAGLVKIGNWNYSKGVSTERKREEVQEVDRDSLKNKTFIVITCLTDPYCMLKESPSSLRGNDRFEGFGIDLIHELSKMEGFNYTFTIREDKANGAKNPDTLKWSGMIGDVIDYRADLAITDLTITAEREEAVDFTSPFMSLGKYSIHRKKYSGISILAQKPSNAPPSFFSFADPFAIDTWIGIAVSYALVTVSLFIVGRMCPDEWTNPYPCVDEPEYLLNQFSLQNSAWFTIGTLLQQGTEVAPIAISTRMMAGVWWFFGLIMVSSYTASLAAFLATENPINLFSDIETLVDNLEKYNLKLGAKAHGATEGFFKKKADDPVYKAIAEYMATHPDDMVSENRHGVTRAEKYHYAFFMESTSIEYETQRACALQQYGKLLDDKGYGIAMRKNSPYRKRLSTAILKLQASGELDNMKRKWWEEKRGGGQCSATTESAAASPLHLENLAGVFYVTIMGTVCSAVFVIIEMFISIFGLKVKARISFKEAFHIEFRNFLNFNSNVKGVIMAARDSSDSLKSSQKNGGIPVIVTEDKSM